MGKLTKERMKMMDEVGEDELFERILSGQTVRSINAELGIGWRAFYKWLDAVDGRRERYEDTLQQAGHAYAARAVDTAQNATSENVNVARLQVDTDKWIASKLNSTYDVRQRETTVTLRVEDLHAQAAALFAHEVEHEMLDMDEDGNILDVETGEREDD
jgi:hypothetical protein